MATAEEKFKQALDEGWTPNEVIDFMRKHKNDEYRSWVKQTWESPEAIPTTTKQARTIEGLDPEVNKLYQSRMKSRPEKMEAVAGKDPFQIPDWMTSPEFLTAIGAAGAGAVSKYVESTAHAGMSPAEAVVGGINSRLMSKYGPAPVEAPTPLQQAAQLSERFQASRQAPNQPAPQTAPTPSQIQSAKFNAAAQAAQQQMSAVQPPAQNAPTTPAAGVQPPAQTSVQTPPGSVAPKSTAPSVAEAIATNQAGSAVADAVVREELGKASGLKTGSGMPAFAGTGPARERMPRGGLFQSAAEIPEGLAFVPGAEHYDSLANAARSHEAAQALVRQHGQYPTSDKQARDWAADYLKATGAKTREAMLEAGEKPDVVKGIFQKIGANKKKLVQMGGVGGALLAIADLAKAETPEERMNAGTGLLEAVLPPGLNINAAGAPTLPPEIRAKQEEFAMLGSPFYHTQEAKNLRQAKKVGAGRGIAPPSAYQR